MRKRCLSVGGLIVVVIEACEFGGYLGFVAIVGVENCAGKGVAAFFFVVDYLLYS